MAITVFAVRIYIPRGTYLVRFVKPLNADPYAVYDTAHGVKVHDWKPDNAMVDAVTHWEPW